LLRHSREMTRFQKLRWRIRRERDWRNRSMAFRKGRKQEPDYGLDKNHVKLGYLCYCGFCEAQHKRSKFDLEKELIEYDYPL